jgi:putative type I restriction enzyme (specificity subunit)
MKSVNQYVMKDSGVQWIGQVPKHWEVCKIKNIGLFYSGLVNKRGDDFNVEETDKFAYYIPFTNIFNNVEIDVTQLRKVKVNPVEAQNEAKENDIFFLMSSEDTEGIGKTAVLRELIAEYKPLYLNSFCKGLRITSNEVDAIFLNYFMSSDAGNTYCRLQANGFIRINLRLTKLVDCPVLLPPLSEQRAIADWLDAKCADIDAAIELQQRMIDKLKAYKTAVIHQAVTKGLDKNAKLKDSGVQWIGEVPEHWEVCKIKNKFMIISGGTPKSDVESYWNGDVVWVTPADYNTEDKVIVKGKRNITKEGLKNSSATILPKNSIIFSKRAPIGLVAINAVPLATNQGCLGCIPKLNVDTIYSYFLLSSFQKQFELLGSGTTFKEISLSSFSSFVIPLPPLAEQRAIADWLDAKCADIDATIALKEQKQEKLKAYKKTIIFEYVTGKKQVANINK